MSAMLKRWMMRRTLTSPLPEPTVASAWQVRTIDLQDGSLVGSLMYAAYHGTIDDEGETPEAAINEMEATLAGKYGPLLTICSFLVEERGQALGASVLTDWSNDQTGERQPLLAFLMTHPDAQGQGMATFLLNKSCTALLTQERNELVLFVTEGNPAAQHIYQKLGFQMIEEFDTQYVKPE